MTRHLTERELIEYQFELASATAAKRIATHLADCPQCSEQLESLKRKYAALELLRGEVDVPESLISRLIDQAEHPPKHRLVSYRKSAWIGAAAAVLLMGSLFLVSNLSRTPQAGQGLSSKGRGGTDGMELVGPNGFNNCWAAGQPGKAVGKSGAKVAVAKAVVGKQPIPEKPPFAPASAIELVVLPRRENVQLTVYNSAFRSFASPKLPPREVQQRGYGLGDYGGGMRGGYGGSRYGGIRSVQAVTQSDGIQQPKRQIAGGDLTLVRETRHLTLKRGWNWLQFAWANTLIDPTSLQLQPLQQKDKISIEQLVFPSRLRELGRWLIRSEVSGQVPFEITYFTTGVTWRAFYMGTLSRNEKKMRLQSYVRVTNNSGEDYENAQTRLIVGRVHILDEIAQLARRPNPYGRPGGYPPPATFSRGGYGGGRDGSQYTWTNDYPWTVWNIYGGVDYFELKPKQVTKEGLSEYFLYTIEGTETIPNQWSKRLQSFDVNDINVTSLYKYDQQRFGRQTIRYLSFANDEDHNLGDTPMPDGSVKIYSIADNNGLLSYVGGAGIKYIPVGEEIELNLGAARLVNVEPTLMEFETANYVFDDDKNISGWDEIRTWKIDITNTRSLPVDIEIMRGFDTSYWSVRADIDYSRYDVTHIRFELTVQPRTKRTFSYTVTTYHGVRQEQINQ